MFLITEKPYQAESSIIEEGNQKNFYLEGILSTAENVNKNGRKYPLSVLQKEFDRYDEQCVKQGTAAGELNHPASSAIDPDRISHRITEINQQGNDFYGKAIVLENDMGNKVRSFIKGGLKVGVSTRALGTTTTVEGVNVINEDLNLICVDVVMNPSNQTSFVNGILEGIDFIMENGVIVPHKIKMEEACAKKESDDEEESEEDIKAAEDKIKQVEEEVERVKEELLKANAIELAEAKMKAFKDFMELITR